MCISVYPYETKQTVRQTALALLLSLICAPLCFGEEPRPSFDTREAELAYSKTSIVATTVDELSHNSQSEVEQITTPVAESSTFDDWSPLIIMVAGIMGLIWVRRHVTNL